MTLLDELIMKRAEAMSEIERCDGMVRRWTDSADDYRRQLADIERAIAALEPAPSTRESVEASEIPEGFNKWEGGECPVPDGARVEVIYRRHYEADPHAWYSYPSDHPDTWIHNGTDGDIIAYRVLEASETESEPQSKGEGTGERGAWSDGYASFGMGIPRDAHAPDPELGEQDPWYAGWDEAARICGANLEAIPPGFTKWNPSTQCRFHGDTLVRCWMGGDDFMGPLLARDVDWDHKSDPVLAVKVVRYSDGRTPEEIETAQNSEAERTGSDSPPTERDRAELQISISDSEQHAKESEAAFWSKHLVGGV